LKKKTDLREDPKIKSYRKKERNRESHHHEKFAEVNARKACPPLDGRIVSERLKNKKIHYGGAFPPEFGDHQVSIKEGKGFQREKRTLTNERRPGAPEKGELGSLLSGSLRKGTRLKAQNRENEGS